MFCALSKYEWCGVEEVRLGSFSYVKKDTKSKCRMVVFFIKIYKQVIFQHECIVSPVQSASGKALHCAWHFHRRNSSVLSYIRFVMLYCIALPARVLFTIKIIIIIIWKSEATNAYTGLNSLCKMSEIYEIGGVRHQIYQRIIFCCQLAGINLDYWTLDKLLFTNLIFLASKLEVPMINKKNIIFASTQIQKMAKF